MDTMCKASVRITWDSSMAPVSRNILGHFIEHLGACVENGIWCYDKPGVPLSNKPHLERVRVDVLEALKALRPPVIRYPGGCFSDTYHWKDGIGSRIYRPTRRNESWGGIKNLLCRMGPLERNHFGTMEFLALCQDVGAEPYINVNFGTGTPREASNWVEYANAGENTRYGRLRKKHGHPEPFNVKIWGIGNEIYGFWEKGFTRNVKEYVNRYLEFAHAMRIVDPSIKLVAVGKPNDSSWNQGVVSGCEGFVDWLSLHWYFGNGNFLRFMFLNDAIPRNEKGYCMEVNSVRFLEAIIKRAERDIRIASPKTRAPACKIAVDEWNVWSQWRQACKADKPFFTFTEGIWSALVLNAFIRHAKLVTLANFAQLVNCLGLILTRVDGEIMLSPQYHVIKLYADNWHDMAAG
ncbi:hypothetical protein GF325_17780, partial [Candidatus Bathyarchaeota archaeon]|nr:hypothetical protein [Candidatus Bathyarchaeota archaeon]